MLFNCCSDKKKLFRWLAFLFVPLLSIVLIYIALSSSRIFGGSELGRGNELLDIFSDFEFVGSDSFSPASKYETLPAHDDKIKPLPSKLEVNHVYFFHYRRSADNEKLLEIIQERLDAKGLQITDKVKAYPFAGKLSFEVQFKVNNYIGTILNIPHSQSRNDNNSPQGSYSEDYVLALMHGDPSK